MSPYWRSQFWWAFTGAVSGLFCCRQSPLYVDFVHNSTTSSRVLNLHAMLPRRLLASPNCWGGISYAIINSSSNNNNNSLNLGQIASRGHFCSPPHSRWTLAAHQRSSKIDLDSFIQSAPLADVGDDARDAGGSSEGSHNPRTRRGPHIHRGALLSGPGNSTVRLMAFIGLSCTHLLMEWRFYVISTFFFASTRELGDLHKKL